MRDQKFASTEISKRATLLELVAAYQAAEASVRDGFAAIHAAKSTLTAARLGDAINILPDGEDHRHGWNVKKAITRMRRDAWRMFIDRMEIRSIISSRKDDELDDWLRDPQELPEISIENLEKFAGQFMERLGELADELVLGVFDWLRPHAWTPASKLKTNNQETVGKRVVLVNFLKVNSGWDFRVTRQDVGLLRDLERLFQSLDGKGVAGKTFRSKIQDAIERPSHKTGATEYFRYKACQNGNLHLEFLRTDLLAKFNQMAGGARLARGKAKPEQPLLLAFTRAA